MSILYHWTWLPVSFVQKANQTLSRLGLPTITLTSNSGIRLFDAMSQIPPTSRRQVLLVLEICWAYYQDNTVHPSTPRRRRSTQVQ